MMTLKILTEDEKPFFMLRCPSLRNCERKKLSKSRAWAMKSTGRPMPYYRTKNRGERERDREREREGEKEREGRSN